MLQAGGHVSVLTSQECEDAVPDRWKGLSELCLRSAACLQVRDQIVKNASCRFVQGQAYLTVVGKALWAVFYRTSSRDGWAGPQGPRQLTAELASREVIARLPHAGQSPLAFRQGPAWCVMNKALSGHCGAMLAETASKAG